MELNEAVIIDSSVFVSIFFQSWNFGFLQSWVGAGATAAPKYFARSWSTAMGRLRNTEHQVFFLQAAGQCD
jgi:hypothetical protein